MLNINQYLNNPKLILIGALRKTARLFSDKFYLKLFYYLETGQKLNFKKPESFNEKLQWLKLYDRNPKYSTMVDKIAVKEYVSSIIGSEYIIPTLGVWNSFEKINFNALPERFVLKTTHDSGGIAICTDKNSFNLKATKNKLNKRLKRNIFYLVREWPYKNVKPRILAEKYLVDESGTELKDYKFFCFNGQVKFCQVDFNRFTNHQRNIYDTNWKLQDMTIKYPNNKDFIIPKPKKFQTMLSIASKLSHKISHVRVDLYSINEKIYFGELTFYQGSGLEKFKPIEMDYVFGRFLELPKKNV